MRCEADGFGHTHTHTHLSMCPQPFWLKLFWLLRARWTAQHKIDRTMASVSALLFDGQARLLREVNERLGTHYLGLGHVARAHRRQLGTRLSRRIKVIQALERHKSTVDEFHGHTCDIFDISDQHVTTQTPLSIPPQYVAMDLWPSGTRHMGMNVNGLAGASRGEMVAGPYGDGHGASAAHCDSDEGGPITRSAISDRRLKDVSGEDNSRAAAPVSVSPSLIGTLSRPPSPTSTATCDPVASPRLSIGETVVFTYTVPGDRPLRPVRACRRHKMGDQDARGGLSGGADGASATAPASCTDGEPGGAAGASATAPVKVEDGWQGGLVAASGLDLGRRVDAEPGGAFGASAKAPAVGADAEPVGAVGASATAQAPSADVKPVGAIGASAAAPAHAKAGVQGGASCYARSRDSQPCDAQHSLSQPCDTQLPIRCRRTLSCEVQPSVADILKALEVPQGPFDARLARLDESTRCTSDSLREVCRRAGF